MPPLSTNHKKCNKKDMLFLVLLLAILFLHPNNYRDLRIKQFLCSTESWNRLHQGNYIITCLINLGIRLQLWMSTLFALPCKIRENENKIMANSLRHVPSWVIQPKSYPFSIHLLSLFCLSIAQGSITEDKFIFSNFIFFHLNLIMAISFHYWKNVKVNLWG